jgi:hypothetical protein
MEQKLGRPKGSKQKRNEDKYKLPNGVTLKLNQTQDYNKETRLVFIDVQYGEFTSTFKALQGANASTHPDSVQNRRNSTNLTKYGSTSPLGDKDILNKFKNTMVEKYGVTSAKKSQVFVDKANATCERNHGVDNPMKNSDIVSKIKENCISTYGVSNPMQTDSVKNKLKNSLMLKYGTENYSTTAEFKVKFFETMTKNGSDFESKPENELKQFVESLGLKCKKGYIGGADPKQIDIMIEDSNVCIEFNGTFWHSEAYGRDRQYHLSKTVQCEKKNKKLIQIFDHEWDNKKDQVKSFLTSALGKNTRKVNARDCDFYELNPEDARDFLKHYHILGSGHISRAYGLMLNGELLSVITLAKHHRNNTELVLNRYVCKSDVTVRGGLSKLTKNIIKEVGSITTWIDRRWSNGQSWLTAGWTVVNTLGPDYFYYNTKTHKIISKQSRKKSLVNTPAGMTESQHAKLDSLVRVWDCGKIKLIIGDKNA